MKKMHAKILEKLNWMHKNDQREINFLEAYKF